MSVPKDYTTWTIPKLNKELTSRGAITKGRKTDLIERLQAYDRNRNFQNDHVPVPEPLTVDWPLTGFKQLTVNHKIVMPKITMEQLEAYFLYRLAGDKQCTGDIKAIEKGQLMYESNRILACSISISDDIYFTGIVGAAMRQKVSYNFKLKLCRQTGDPMNSHCECPAGRGPHGTCKHLAAVLLMLQNFVSNGDIKIERSCTESIMTFHKPKATHHGSPVKAENLTNKRKVSDDFFADPRPAKYRLDPAFNDRVRNLVVNYCSATSKDLSYRYLFPKADIQSAALDHHYEKLKLTEHWINKGIQVDQNRVNTIEKLSRKQSGCGIWFKERAWRLTASKFGEICKATCRRNTLKLCNSICNSHFTTNATLHGKNYERKALVSFEARFNVKTKSCGLIVSEKYPFLGASPDALVEGEDAVVEIKCPYSGRNEEIKPGPHFKFLMYENKSIVLKKSSSYCDQIQGQMFVSNRKSCYFVVYTFQDIFVQKLLFDEPYCMSCLLPKLSLFYEKFYRPYLASRL